MGPQKGGEVLGERLRFQQMEQIYIGKNQMAQQPRRVTFARLMLSAHHLIVDTVSESEGLAPGPSQCPDE